MPSLPDYHMHTPLCRHASGEPTDYAARAAALGLTEIGFSDHSPMPRDDFDDWRMRQSDLPAYVEKVNHARAEFPGLAIRLGLEVDFIPGQEDWIRDLASRYPWDYLIGSVHYLTPSWAVDNPHRLSEWKLRDPGEVWGLYAERLALAAQSGLFDIIAHIDLCKKFCYYPPGDFVALFEPFLAAAKQADVAIELNTAGLRKDCREIYPGPKLLRRAAEHGVAITFGSDAHAPEEVGMGFAEAESIARECGYDRYRVFQGRKCEYKPL
jgi:histidinol-phosphatase (PHP family)